MTHNMIMPCGGLDLTYQKTPKWGVFARKFEGSHSRFYKRKYNNNVQNNVFFIKMHKLGNRNIFHNLGIITDQTTLRTNMVEPTGEPTQSYSRTDPTGRPHLSKKTTRGESFFLVIQFFP